MKMILLSLIFSMISACLTAPPYVCGDILRPEPIHHDPMLSAFMFVESSYRTDVVNSLGYTGILQIGPEMIAEANRINEITGNPRRYTFPESALDPVQAVHVWYDVQNYHNPDYTLLKAISLWNPKGNKEYYRRIKRLI